MKTLVALLRVLPAFALLAPAVRAAEIGDAAAPLEIAEWVKGDAVDLAAVKGKKIVVVEFWATWCGPCRTSIPHLTEMQKQFADRGVVFVGVSTESAAKVQPFVDEMGDKMDYTVAIDRDGKTSEGYMKAFGQNGIPHAFVVDREGKVAWQGHPMAGLDKVLEKMASQPVPEDPADKQRAAAQRALREFTDLAGRGGDEPTLSRLEQQLTQLDQQLGGIVPGQKLDLAAVRKSARFQNLVREYQIAVAAGRPEAELQKLEAQAAPLAPKGFKFEEFRGQFSLQRTFQDYYRAVTGKGDAARIPDLAARLEAVKSTDAEALNEMAWTLLTDEKIKQRNPALALKLAQAAFDASGGKDPGVLDTYARALFDNGKVADAIQQQQRALQLNTDEDKRAELEQSLKRYQANPVSK
jgi:thiol-disulfide isomerase/thioredoxin